MLRIKLLVPATALLALVSAYSFAAPKDDAQAHFAAIAAGNVTEIMKHYDSRAHLEWVGGPLDGAYSTPQAIGGVWKKFTTAQGTMKLSVASVEEAANPKGTTVTANVLFEGKMPVKVRYVLTWRNGKIVDEIWQVAPSLNVSASY
ncbi:nuclear transport factor 2 family protein [Raoultella sp. HC6]|uniref:nuclear transport factor 2 family protein n=1 Tax=Raoultella sp. HC6 TaxID=2923366 RepID=UPI001F509FAC|nr:nuclear transport factor 2 family protein [Raoultella sp. HC6]